MRAFRDQRGFTRGELREVILKSGPTETRHTGGKLAKVVTRGFTPVMTNPADDRRIQAIERPDGALWKYYLLLCLAFPPAFPFAILPMYFRYHTMRYKFSDDGISMSWGILFRRQIIVNYARIQDIHLKSNIVERWLGLARILVQTASGSQSAELVIEGIKEFELLRDYLYSRMRGVQDQRASPSAPMVSSLERAPAPAGELAAVLREVAAELRAVREAMPAARPFEAPLTSGPEEKSHV